MKKVSLFFLIFAVCAFGQQDSHVIRLSDSEKQALLIISLKRHIVQLQWQNLQIKLALQPEALALQKSDSDLRAEHDQLERKLRSEHKVAPEMKLDETSGEFVNTPETSPKVPRPTPTN